jgi:MarR family transcriptional regulator for hemolysin
MLNKYDTETLGFLISDVARLLRAEFDRRTSDAGMGLTPGEARALSALARAGTIRQAVLAERMGIEAMTLSTYLDRLESRGLVSRATDPSDRRAKLVNITEAAHAVMDQIARVGEGIRADMAGHMSQDQIEELRRTMRQIRSNLVAMRPECGRASTAA